MDAAAQAAVGLPDTFAGWLEKKNRLNNGSWRSRYFALRGQYLLCFSDPESGRVIASIDVVKVEVCGPEAGDAEAIFNLKVLEGSIKLRAPDAAARSRWQNVLATAQTESKDASRRQRSQEHRQEVMRAYNQTIQLRKSLSSSSSSSHGTRRRDDDAHRDDDANRDDAGDDDGPRVVETFDDNAAEKCSKRTDDPVPPPPPSAAVAPSSSPRLLDGDGGESPRISSSGTRTGGQRQFRVNTNAESINVFRAAAGYHAATRHASQTRATTAGCASSATTTTTSAQRPPMVRAQSALAVGSSQRTLEQQQQQQQREAEDSSQKRSSQRRQPLQRSASATSRRRGVIASASGFENKTDAADWGEPEAEAWIRTVLDEDAEEDVDFWAWLRDGTVLCRVANALKPNAVRLARLHKSTNRIRSLENISFFLAACRHEFKIDGSRLFDSADLYDGKGPRSVLSCLHALKMAAENDFSGSGSSLTSPSEATSPRARRTSDPLPPKGLAASSRVRPLGGSAFLTDDENGADHPPPPLSSSSSSKNGQLQKKKNGGTPKLPTYMSRKRVSEETPKDPTYVPTHLTVRDEGIADDSVATVIEEHVAMTPDELDVYEGDVVTVKLSKGGWCFEERDSSKEGAWSVVQKGGEQGLVPTEKLRSGVTDLAYLKGGAGRGSSELDRHLAAKNSAKYDANAEALAQHWIEQVTGHVFRRPFYEELKDGALLCRLVNEIASSSSSSSTDGTGTSSSQQQADNNNNNNSVETTQGGGGLMIPKIYKGDREFNQRDNIKLFLNAAKRLGVRSSDAFDTDDLFDRRDLGLVVNCLFRLSDAVVTSVPNFTGPYLTGHGAGWNDAVMSNLKVIVAVNDFRDRARALKTREELASGDRDGNDTGSPRDGGLGSPSEDVINEAVEYRLAMLGLRDSQVAGAKVSGVDRAKMEPSFLVVWSSSTKSNLSMEKNERRLLQLLAAKKKRYEMVYLDCSPERKIELHAITRGADVPLPALTFGADYRGPFEAIQELEDEGGLDELLEPAPSGEGFWALPEAWGVQSSMLEGGGMQIVNEVPTL